MGGSWEVYRRLNGGDVLLFTWCHKLKHFEIIVNDHK